MRAKVRTRSLHPDLFDVTGEAKQGCVLAPVLLKIHIHCVTFLLHKSLDAGAGAHITLCIDRNIFHLNKLKACEEYQSLGAPLCR